VVGYLLFIGAYTTAWYIYSGSTAARRSDGSPRPVPPRFRSRRVLITLYNGFLSAVTEEMIALARQTSVFIKK